MPKDHPKRLKKDNGPPSEKGSDTTRRKGKSSGHKGRLQKNTHEPHSFSKFTRFLTRILGHPICFIAALAAVIIWALMGSYYNFNDTWQLVINTSTTIATFLMVFLLQNTQNRDTFSIQLKLDEIIKSHKTARNEMIDIEEMSEEELERIHKQICAKIKK